MSRRIFPVILAGGSGTRLWPVSRRSYPKQFAQLLDETSLLQQTALRFQTNEHIDFESIITITNSDYRFLVAEQLQLIGVDPGAVMIEPEAKNTAAAIIAAALYTHSIDPDAVLLVAPSDHIIRELGEFHSAVSTGLSYTESGSIVTFGITPTKPETGYGYLQLSTSKLDPAGAARIDQFVEKPDAEEAQQMLSSGNFFWNAGIFLFKASVMIEAFKDLAPRTLDLVKRSLEAASQDLGFLRLAPSCWSELDDISIDYLIMEKVNNLVAVPFEGNWSDLGGWNAIWEESSKDKNGNALFANALAMDCSNTLLRSENVNQHIVGLGLTDVLAVAMPDAVLVAHKDEAQNVKRIVDKLIAQKVPQADTFPEDFRPWGWFESLAKGQQFQVKRIVVKSKAALSLQSHKFRSEHWIVVEGTAKVTIDQKVNFLDEGQSIYVPLGAKHRLENPGDTQLVLIEVQIGSYLGEDDIVRYEDLYKRK